MGFSISGNIVDLINRRIFSGTVYVDNGRIKEIKEETQPQNAFYILPGFIDSHIHIESSMLIPSEFARLASVHGTVATVSDPHEIANVLGVEGIRYMIANAQQVPFHFYFGAPSCVPATQFETAGASITADHIETFFKVDQLKYLSEKMNYPGVLSRDPEVMKKIAVAKSHGKPIDGHAPGLRGSDAEKYISEGISTDHECFSLEEALDKVRFGMHILIREGSAAKNFEALHPLFNMFPEKVMFCSDDKHPHELIKGHINTLVKRSIVEKKYDLMNVLRAACVNPILHYKLDTGILRTNDSADFIVVDNLHDFNILETYVKGIMTAKNGRTLIPSIPASTPNHFSTPYKKPEDFSSPGAGTQIHVIQAIEGQLITRKATVDAKISNQCYVQDLERDILKLTVVNRYSDAKPAVAFIQNFGLKKGAIASSVAHDCHNIIAVGCTDDDICKAVNHLIDHKGGLVAVSDNIHQVLPLPVAGLMSNEDGYRVAEKYEELEEFVKQLGSPLHDPFMTLSFMALLVIPELKLSDQGLFDGTQFAFIPLSADLAGVLT